MERGLDCPGYNVRLRGLEIGIERDTAPKFGTARRPWSSSGYANSFSVFLMNILALEYRIVLDFCVALV
jgi:hypothetical protein